jgi:hypothetical protein
MSAEDRAAKVASWRDAVGRTLSANPHRTG